MSDPYTEKLAELVRRIYRQTATGKVRWAENDELLEDSFSTRIANRIVNIRIIDYQNDGDPAQDVEISISDLNGKRIESVRDTTLYDVHMDVDGFSGWYSIMNHIYETARRQVSGSEDAINDILESLDDMPF